MEELNPSFTTAISVFWKTRDGEVLLLQLQLEVRSNPAALPEHSLTSYVSLSRETTDPS